MKYAVIAGVSGGMGYAAARKLTKEGYTVFGLDICEPEALPGLIYIPADLTDNADIMKAAETVGGITDKISCIVHMAGIYDLDSLVEIDDQAFQRILDINLSAAYRVNKAFLPVLEKGGKIIIVTSELAPLDPLPFTGIYAITKAALDRYAWSLRMELQLLGYHVTVLRPGAVKTGMILSSKQALDRFCSSTKLYPFNAARFHQIVDRIEARSIRPEKVAQLVYKVLCSDHPRMVYNLNRNPLLLLMNMLPGRLQCMIIRKILSN